MLTNRLRNIQEARNSFSTAVLQKLYQTFVRHKEVGNL
jgi:hypothetical protein